MKSVPNENVMYVLTSKSKQHEIMLCCSIRAEPNRTLTSIAISIEKYHMMIFHMEKVKQGFFCRKYFSCLIFCKFISSDSLDLYVLISVCTKLSGLLL